MFLILNEHSSNNTTEAELHVIFHVCFPKQTEIQGQLKGGRGEKVCTVLVDVFAGSDSWCAHAQPSIHI